MTDITNAYLTYLHALPAVMQPVVQGFLPSLPVWLAVAIYDRRWSARHGKPSPAKKVSAWIAVPFFAALFYLRTRYAEARAILDWPDTHWPLWHRHWWQLLIGCLVAGFVAKALGDLYAAIFLRGGRNYGGAGYSFPINTHDMLPDPPPGFGWYRRPQRQLVTRQRTFYTHHEED